MLEEEIEKTIAVPQKIVWEWSKDIRNVASAISRIEIKVRPSVSRGFLRPPRELTAGQAVMTVCDEEEKYSKVVVNGEAYRVENSLQCEKISKNKTEVTVRVKIEFKGLSGDILEKLIFLPIISSIVLQKRLDVILENLLNNLEDYMRKRWRKGIGSKIKDLQFE